MLILALVSMLRPITTSSKGPELAIIDTISGSVEDNITIVKEEIVVNIWFNLITKV